MWNEGIRWLTQMMGYNEYVPLITYKANEWCGGKSIPYNFWCPWFDRHFLQITACMKWTRTPTKRNALNGNTIQDYLQLEWLPEWLQSRLKVIRSLELYHASPIPLINVREYIVSRFFHQKGKNHLIINTESGGSGELRVPAVLSGIVDAICSDDFFGRAS